MDDISIWEGTKSVENYRQNNTMPRGRVNKFADKEKENGYLRETGERKSRNLTRDREREGEKGQLAGHNFEREKEKKRMCEGKRSIHVVYMLPKGSF